MQTMRMTFAFMGRQSWCGLALAALLSISFMPAAFAQADAALPSTRLAPVVPQQMRFAGAAANRAGDTVEAVFSVYATAEGGEPLWTETQRMTVDATGEYSVLLGSATKGGLPQTLFAGGQARWLGVSIDRAEEQPRIQLASVAYAMKAGDAETVGGLAAGSLVTQQQLNAMAKSFAAQATPAIIPDVTPSGSGTTNYVPLWMNSTTLGNSALYQFGTKIGLGTTSPVAALQVTTPYAAVTTNGANYYNEFLINPTSLSIASGVTDTGYRIGEQIYNFTSDPNFLGTLAQQMGLWARVGDYTGAGTGTITNSYGVYIDNLTSGSSHITNSYGLYQEAPTAKNYFAGKVGIGTITPAGMLEVNGTAKFDGLITFAAGQTFPGGGGGTITSVATTSPLTGGASAGAVSLGMDTSALETTLNSVYAQLGATDTFTSQEFFSDGMVASMAAGANFSATQGLGSNGSIGVYGSSDTGYGVEGISSSGVGVYATSTSGNAISASGGVSGGGVGQIGVRAVGGTSSATGEVGGPGLSGQGGNGPGSFGNSGGGDGIDAAGGSSTTSSSVAGNGGYLVGGSVGPGIYGGNGVYSFGGKGEQGGYGISAFGGDAVVGCGNLCTAGAGGVFNGGGGSATNGGDGVLAYAGDQGGTGVVGVSCSGYSDSTNCLYAGEFLGDVDVVGNVSKSGGSFKIDDPIDPSNKYLYHSFVESPDMKNIYDGTVVTDGDGRAQVTLPEYFEALNSDFRYQLTVIGQFAQAIVETEISDNSFTIRTDKPNVKVSWQVTGIRQDAWAKAHRIPEEVEKDKAEKGHYLHPELFGHQGEASIPTLHHPRPTMSRRR